MNRGLALLLVAIASLGTAIAWAGARHIPADRPPNVVLIIIDTLRADKLGSYGYPLDTSPELDDLARRGTRFGRVIAESSWTRPSIGAMLTSRYPRTLGIYDEQWDVLRDDFTTLAEALHAHGYRTLGATANPNINSVFAFDQGFDHYQDSTVVFRWMHKQPGQKFAEQQHLLLAEDVFGSLLRQLDAEGPEARRRPHYLQANLMEVHESLRVGEWLRPEYADLFPGVEPVERQYLQAIRQVSDDVSRFIDRLRARPGFENTLFVITSDHGQGLRSHPHVPVSMAHGLYLYEASVEVPLILFHPGGRRVHPDRVVQRPVRLVDLMPTVLDLVGMDRPPAPMEGISLVPLLRGHADVEEPPVFITETEFREAHKMAAYGDDWAYIENRDRLHGMPPAELQRIGAPDDGARTSRLREHPREAKRLKRALEAWERAHPSAPRAAPERSLTQAEKEQLRALGYAR